MTPLRATQYDATNKKWRVVATVICVAVGVQMLSVLNGLPHPLMLLAYVLYCAGCVSALVVVVAGVRMLGARSFAPLPVLPNSLASSRAAVVGLAGCVVLGIAVREGATGSELDFHAFNANDNTTWDSTSTGSSTAAGDALPSFANRPTSCQVMCNREGQTCGAVQAHLRCDGAAHDALQITVHVEVEDTFCYTPWYKEAEVTFGAEVSFMLSANEAVRSHTMSMSGKIRQDAFGPLSCRGFRERIGERIADALAQDINNVLQSN